MTSKRLLLLLKFPSFLSQKMWNCSRRVSLSICIFFTASLLFFFSLPSKKVYLTLLFTVFENGQNCLTFKSCAQKSNSKRFELFQKSLIFLFLAGKFKNFSEKKIRVFIFARLIEMKFVHFTKIGIFCIFLNTVNFTNLFLSKQCF